MTCVEASQHSLACLRTCHTHQSPSLVFRHKSLPFARVLRSYTLAPMTTVAHCFHFILSVRKNFADAERLYSNIGCRKHLTFLVALAARSFRTDTLQYRPIMNCTACSGTPRERNGFNCNAGSPAWHSQPCMAQPTSRKHDRLSNVVRGTGKTKPTNAFHIRCFGTSGKGYESGIPSRAKRVE